MKKTIFTLMLFCCCLAGCGDGTAWLATGVAPEATVMCIKSAGEEGSAGAVNIVKGMEWAVEHGCDLISLSLGVAKAEIADKELLRHTCDALLDAGIVVIAAAGNEGSETMKTTRRPPLPRMVPSPGRTPNSVTTPTSLASISSNTSKATG